MIGSAFKAEEPLVVDSARDVLFRSDRSWYS